MKHKRGTYSRNKGFGFERRVVNLLNTWAGEKLFRRAWLSKSQPDLNVYGDIIVPEQFPFSIQCKNQEKWTFAGLFSNNSGKIYRWYEEARNDCAENKTALLIFTKNYFPILAMVNTYTVGYRKFIGQYLRSDKEFIWYDHYSIFPLEAWLNQAPFENVKTEMTKIMEAANAEIS